MHTKPKIHEHLSGAHIRERLQGVHASTPATILGDLLHTWLVAKTADDFTYGAGNAIATWKNREIGAGDPAQPTALLRPAYDADVFNGQPGVVGDGTQWMECALDTPIASGSRPYMWIVCRWHGVPSTTAVRRAFSINGDDASFSSCVYTTLAANFDIRSFGISDHSVPGSSETIETIPFDTDPHLFEYGLLDTITDKAVVDGVGFDGDLTGTLTDDLDVAYVLRAQLASAVFADCSVAEVVVASSIPTAAQLTAMRSYFTGRQLGLTIV